MTDPQASEPTPSQLTPSQPAAPSQPPPPLPPAGQFAPPPPIAAGPPGGGPRPVLPVMPYSDGYAPYWVPPPRPPENPRAKTLILWSHILGWGGLWRSCSFGSLIGGVALSGPGGDPTAADRLLRRRIRHRGGRRRPRAGRPGDAGKSGVTRSHGKQRRSTKHEARNKTQSSKEEMSNWRFAADPRRMPLRHSLFRFGACFGFRASCRFPAHGPSFGFPAAAGCYFQSSSA